MNSPGFHRKLTTIFSADVAGYSRLMGADETATVKTLTGYRKVLGDLILQHRGRVIDSPGDNLLAEFTSVVDAVQCAVAVQNEIKVRNAALPEDRRMEFRIGINLGDVIEEEDHIYGDGVNIAARLEGMADPGGICISKTAFDHIESKLPLGYEFLGDQEVKNIAKPVGAYRVLMEPRVTVAGPEEKKSPRPMWRRKGIFAGVAVIFVLIIGALVWNFQFRPPAVESDSNEKKAYPLPDKPSIAVLPFENLSNDPEQEYFSDGISEEIINALVRWPSIKILPKSSSFVYKDKNVDVNQVGREMGVRYVLDGSVRREGNRVRVAVQLIDSATRKHLFSERYEREMEDIFAIQDEITMGVLAAMRVSLSGEGVPSLRGRPTKSIDAYLKLLQAEDIFQAVNRDTQARAGRLAEEAIALDPEYARAHALLAATIGNQVLLGVYENREKALERAIAHADEAIQLDDSENSAPRARGFLALLSKDYDRAVQGGRRAVELAPNSVMAQIVYAYFLYSAGKTQEAIPILEKAATFTPIPHPRALSHLGVAYRKAGRQEDAVKVCTQLIQMKPDYIYPHLTLAAAFAEMDKMEEARAEIKEVLRINPKYNIEIVLQSFPWKDQGELERLSDSLRKAGLPETPPLPLPDKPSIAVLPFENMSGDPEQDYFADGLSEEIITGLSKIPKLFVIARNSSFTYKGKSVWIPTVAKELGVVYVLEGSVRKSGEKVRVTAQLIDARSNSHIWADRYDKDLKDIFDIQDAITKKVITALQIKLTEGEQALVYARGTRNLQAYLKLLEAFDYGRRQNPNDNQTAKRILEEAIALDHNYAPAYRLMGAMHMMDVWMGSTKSPRESLKTAAELCQKAIALDASLGSAHALLGHVYILLRDYEKGIEEGRKAVELEPNGADSHGYLGLGLTYADQPEEAVKMFQKAIRLNPMAPSWYFHCLACAYRNMGRYNEAVEWAKKAVERSPNNAPAHLVLTSCYSLAGLDKEARAEAAELLKINPHFSLERFAETTPLRDPDVKTRLIGALRKAGLK